jgi:diguanylate cyclase (GGDEF)-like protein
MPKSRKPPRKPAETLRVASFLGASREPGDPSGSLLVVQGAEVDLGRHVMCDLPVIIGRDETADLALSDGSISRAHCKVERLETGRYMLIDLGSTNGTALNGERVQGAIPLNPGDKIFLGASVIRFAYADQLDLQFHSRLEEMVSIDPLTGMSSKRQYDATYQVMVERSAADGTPLVVMVMDMDGLKQINDTSGHEMGGFVIAEVAGIIRSVLEDYGYLCRFGGDEFVGAFANMDVARAMTLAEEVRDRVSRHDFTRNGVRAEPTVSIGVAGYPGDVARPDELFAAADRAMYAAKHAGKNAVRASRPSGSD